MLEQLEQLKERIKTALARFAKRKTREQAEGMATEAKDIVASTKSAAQRNPAGFALLVLLGVGFVYLQLRQHRTVKNAS
ncbi:hypothetical protein EON80_25250 [bacterium]|nr:MAG: hypothetical protein EON80_25250 [bacterium]